jgi:hypothetical protein
MQNENREILMFTTQVETIFKSYKSSVTSALFIANSAKQNAENAVKLATAALIAADQSVKIATEAVATVEADIFKFKQCACKNAYNYEMITIYEMQQMQSMQSNMSLSED